MATVSSIAIPRPESGGVVRLILTDQPLEGSGDLAPVRALLDRP